MRIIACVASVSDRVIARKLDFLDVLARKRLLRRLYENFRLIAVRC